MLSLLLHQLAVCLLLFALLTLSMDCFVLFRKRGKSRGEVLNLVIAAMLWVVTSYKALYEGLFVFIFAYSVFDILYSIAVLLFSIYVAKQLSLVRKMKNRMEYHFMLFTATVSASTAVTAKKLRTTWLYPSKIRKVDQILDTEIYESRLTIEQLACKTGINRTYLSRYFNQQIGVPYLKYFENRRLKKVIEKLKNSQESITEIYESAGFNASTFYSTFKANFGTTPEQWRKVYQQSLTCEKQQHS